MKRESFDQLHIELLALEENIFAVRPKWMVSKYH
jgi:hypothetical protein